MMDDETCDREERQKSRQDWTGRLEVGVDTEEEQTSKSKTISDQSIILTRRRRWRI
jgi:hypothetical protein